MMTSVPIYIAEAFTSGNNEAHTGNPAAVVLLEYDNDITDELKQKIAKSMAISETAFVSLGWTRPSDKQTNWSESGPDSSKTLQRVIRWFAPAGEIPLCGHATVATSKSLLTHYRNEGNIPNTELPLETIRFESKHRGTVEASFTIQNGFDIVTLNFPANPPIDIDIPSSGDWLPKLCEAILGPHFPKLSEELEDVTLSLTEKIMQLRLKLDPQTENPQEKIKKLEPHIPNLLKARTGSWDVEYYIVTIMGEGDKGKPHFYSRVFAPFYGNDEDPVCGAAHTILAAYWVNKLGLEGKTLYARQESPRGGDVLCRIDGDRAMLSGKARVSILGVINL